MNVATATGKAAKLTTGLTAMLCGIGLSVSANAAIIPFFIDVDGDGDTSNAVRVDEFLGMTGQLAQSNTYTGATSFNFTQNGSFQVFGADGNINLALIIAGVDGTVANTGTGDLSTGLLSYDAGGSLAIASGSTTIAQFTVTGGDGFVSFDGQPNGFATIAARATNFAANYFYMNDGGTVGADLSTIDLSTAPGDPGRIFFGYNTTGLSLVQNPAPTYDSNGRLTSGNFQADGQFRLSEEVPAPATLGLIGLGLLGLGSLRGKRA